MEEHDAMHTRVKAIGDTSKNPSFIHHTCTLCSLEHIHTQYKSTLPLTTTPDLLNSHHHAKQCRDSKGAISDLQED